MLWLHSSESLPFLPLYHEHFHPCPSGCCLASYSFFQRQLGSLALLHTWAGIHIRGWCFHSTPCWSLPLYLAHFNKTICLPTVFPHQYTNIHPLVCRQVVPMPLSCLAEQSIPANPHNSCFLPTHWQFPSVPSSDGHHNLSNGKSQNLGSNFESSGFCLLTQSKPINLTSKIPQSSISLHSLLLHHFPQETKKKKKKTLHSRPPLHKSPSKIMRLTMCL